MICGVIWLIFVYVIKNRQKKKKPLKTKIGKKLLDI